MWALSGSLVGLPHTKWKQSPEQVESIANGVPFGNPTAASGLDFPALILASSNAPEAAGFREAVRLWSPELPALDRAAEDCRAS